MSGTEEDTIEHATICNRCYDSLNFMAKQTFDHEGRLHPEKLCFICFGLLQPTIEDPKSLYRDLQSLPEFIASTEYDMGDLCLSASFSNLIALRIHQLYPHTAKDVLLVEFLRFMRRSVRQLIVKQIPIDHAWIDEEDAASGTWRRFLSNQTSIFYSPLSTICQLILGTVR